MKISYEGMGQWAATFACGEVAVGQVVEVAAEDSVKSCADGGAFAGVVLAKARGGDACTVALGGAVEVHFSGSAPAVGFQKLSADGEGGVKLDAGGREHLILASDDAAKCAVIVL